MSLFDQRVIYSNNGTLSDISLEMNNFRSGTSVIPYVATEDYIYIGSILPWSSRWFEVSVANAVTASIVVEYYDSTWKTGVDVFDTTSVSGKTLAQSGYVRFSRNRRQNSWQRTSETAQISELSSLYIYDMYWMRISFSASLTGTTALKYIGNKFSGDSELYSQYPDLNQSALKLQFASGKTTWDEQSFIAARTISEDLKTKEMIYSSDQILDPTAFELASVHKTAEIIYGALGDAFKDNRDRANVSYNKEMNKRYKNIDVTGDGDLSLEERGVSYGSLHR